MIQLKNKQTTLYNVKIILMQLKMEKEFSLKIVIIS